MPPLSATESERAGHPSSVDAPCADRRALLELVPTDLYIDGRWRPASGGRYFPVEDPATGGKGYFYTPTVLTAVSPATRIWREEIFGPVATIATFSTESQAVEMANDTECGLAAYVFTRDLSRAIRLTEQIEAGMMGVNTGLISNPAAPFEGVKQSGLGREGGAEGIDEYLDVKYTALAVAP